MEDSRGFPWPRGFQKTSQTTKKRRRESERARFLRLGKCRVSWCLLFREPGSFRFDGADLRDLGCSLVSFYYALAPFLLTASPPFSSFCLRLRTASPPPLRVSFLSSSAPVKRAPFSPFPLPFRLRALLVCFFPPCSPFFHCRRHCALVDHLMAGLRNFGRLIGLLVALV